MPHLQPPPPPRKDQPPGRIIRAKVRRPTRQPDSARVANGAGVAGADMAAALVAALRPVPYPLRRP